MTNVIKQEGPLYIAAFKRRTDANDILKWGIICLGVEQAKELQKVLKEESVVYEITGAVLTEVKE